MSLVWNEKLQFWLNNIGANDFPFVLCWAHGSDTCVTLSGNERSLCLHIHMSNHAHHTRKYDTMQGRSIILVWCIVLHFKIFRLKRIFSKIQATRASKFRAIYSMKANTCKVATLRLAVRLSVGTSAFRTITTFSARKQTNYISGYII